MDESKIHKSVSSPIDRSQYINDVILRSLRSKTSKMIGIDTHFCCNVSIILLMKTLKMIIIDIHFCCRVLIIMIQNKYDMFISLQRFCCRVSIKIDVNYI